MRTRWTAILALGILVVAGVWLYTLIWGNPLVTTTMKGRVLDYLAERYPDDQFLPTKTGYDFLNRRYIVRVVGETDPPVVFTVTYGPSLVGQDDYRERKMEEEVVRQLTPVVKTVMPIATVRASVARTREGSGRPILVGVEWTAPGLDLNGFVEAVREMAPVLQSSGLQVDEYLFSCNVHEVRDLHLSLTPEQLSVEKSDLLPLVGRGGKW